MTDKSGLEAGDERKIRDRREEESRNTGQDVGGHHRPPWRHTAALSFCSVSSSDRRCSQLRAMFLCVYRPDVNAATQKKKDAVSFHQPQSRTATHKKHIRHVYVEQK